MASEETTAGPIYHPRVWAPGEAVVLCSAFGGLRVTLGHNHRRSCSLEDFLSSSEAASGVFQPWGCSNPKWTMSFLPHLNSF